MPLPAAIKAKVYNVIAKHEVLVPRDQIDDSKDLTDDCGMDSVTKQQLAPDLNADVLKPYSTMVTGPQCAAQKTVGDIVKLVSDAIDAAKKEHAARITHDVATLMRKTAGAPANTPVADYRFNKPPLELNSTALAEVASKISTIATKHGGSFQASTLKSSHTVKGLAGKVIKSIKYK